MISEPQQGLQGIAVRPEILRWFRTGTARNPPFDKAGLADCLVRRPAPLVNIVHEHSRMTERRLQPRLLDSELIMVSWIDDGVRLNQLGNVKDLSLGGMGILADRALPLGTAVAISYGEGELAGIVRHTSELVDGHFIGIEFVGGSRNSTLHFQPELLIPSLLSDFKSK